MAVVFPIAYKTDTSGLKKSQSEFSKFASGLKSTLALAGIGIGISEIASQLKDAAKAAVEDSKGQALLATALKNTVGANADQIASVEQSIAQMQNQAAVADDVIRPAFAALVGSTKDVASATDLMGVALDLAAYKGIDVQSASEALAKAHQGVTKGLFTLMPELRNSSNYMKDLRDATAGAAATAANADPFQQMSIVMQDLQERVGFYLLPALKKLADYMASQDFSNAMDNTFAGFDKIGSAMDNLTNKFPSIKTGLGSIFDQFAKNGNWVSAIPILGAWINILNGENKPKTGSKGKTTPSVTIPNVAALSGNQVFGTAPVNPKPGQVYTYYTYADGMDKPVVWWTQTWTGKTWTKAVRMTYAPKSTGSSSGGTAAQALAQRIQDIKDFKSTITSNLADLIPEARVTTEMGDFQKKVVSGFEAIAQSMQDAFDNKLIAADALAVFKKYAAGEQATLEQIAKARDVLSKKIDIAKQLTQSVRDMGNITAAINKQSETVTESYTKVIDGVNVTVSKTMDVVKSTDIVDQYKAIIDKTKTFASNLKALKAAGLNGQLFAQIVNAGTDAGGQTAAAIVAGGADTVSSLNDLFGQLDDAATAIAATSTDIMYQTGLDITNSFIDGLVAQDLALQNAATTLAQNFNAAFKAALDLAVPDSGKAGANAKTIADVFDKNNIPKDVKTGSDIGKAIVDQIITDPGIKDLQSNVIPLQTIQDFMALGLSVGEAVKAIAAQNTLNAPLVADSRNAPGSNASPTVNVTVNAGMGADGKSIGLSIVQVLKQYERTNGAVWQSA